jgi:hypothetical protein
MSKQLVPRELVAEAPAVWNEQADKFNHWNTLGEEEKLEWVANRAAQWALDKAAKECDLLANMFQCCARGAENEGKQAFYLHQHAATRHCENAIRALAETGGDE